MNKTASQNVHKNPVITISVDQMNSGDALNRAQVGNNILIDCNSDGEDAMISGPQSRRDL